MTMKLRLEITLDIQKQNSKTEKIMLSQITTLVDILQGRERVEGRSLPLDKLVSKLRLQEYIEKKIQRISI